MDFPILFRELNFSPAFKYSIARVTYTNFKKRFICIEKKLCHAKEHLFYAII